MSRPKPQIHGWFFNEVLKQTDLHAKDLICLLDLIQAPGNLQRLFRVLKQLHPILEIAADICATTKETEPIKERIEQSKTVLQKLLEIEPKLSNNPLLNRLFPLPGETAKKSVHGIIGTNPLFACLAHKPYGTLYICHYQHLLAQLIVSTHVILEDNPEDIKRLATAFQSIRDLSEPTDVDQLQVLPTKPLHPLDYYESTQSSLAGEEIRFAGGIIEKAQKGFKKKRTPKGTLAKARRPPPTRLEELEEDEDPIILSTGTRQIPSGVFSEKEGADYVKQGGSQHEFESGQDHFAVSGYEERDYTGTTLRELAFQAKHSSNRIALSNQHSDLAWNRLNQFDVSVLLRYLNEEITSDTPPAEARSIRTLLCLLFWTGIDTERALSLTISPTSITDKTPADNLNWTESKSPRARLYSPGPHLKEESYKSTSKLALKVSQFTQIPLPEFALKVLPANLTRLKEDTSIAQLINATDPTILNKQIKSELSSLNKRFGCRLSLKRIQHCLLYALAEEEGEDLPSAKLFFGYLHNESDTRMHYTCAPARRMESSFRALCSKMLHEMGFDNVFRDNDFVNDEVSLGTPFCPQIGAIQNLAANLKDAVFQSRTNLKSLSSTRNFHNIYAIYTACLISFATSYRAVNDPSFREDEIHFESGIGVISDKDDHTFYHSRAVWIPDVCLEQIRLYRQHLQVLFDVIGHQSSSLLKLFQQQSGGKPLRLFFIRRGDNKLLPITPGRLSRHLQRLFNYDLRIHSNRHYIKTELLAMGCPPDVIEAELGHWMLGQEPWNRFSNFHPIDFRSHLNKHISAILQRDGWVPIKGVER